MVMRWDALLLIVAALSEGAAAQEPASPSRPPRPTRQPYVIPREEFRDARPRGDPEKYYSMWAALRPEWERFELSVARQNVSPSGFRPGTSALPGSTCYGFEVYLDDHLLRTTSLAPPVAELAEIRLIRPQSTRQIADSLVRTGNCGALHLISLKAWTQLTDRTTALDMVERIGSVTVDELDVVFAAHGFAWRANGSKEITYQHPDRPDCGEFRRAVNPSWEVLSRSMREQMLKLLRCIQPA